MLFAANAAIVDTAKFLQFVRIVIATANDTIVTANNASILRIKSYRRILVTEGVRRRRLELAI